MNKEMIFIQDAQRNFMCFMDSRNATTCVFVQEENQVLATITGNEGIEWTNKIDFFSCY